MLRYLRGTISCCLVLQPATCQLAAYADSDWAKGSDRVSTTEKILQAGGATVLWRGLRQRCTALSSP